MRTLNGAHRFVIRRVVVVIVVMLDVAVIRIFGHHQCRGARLQLAKHEAICDEAFEEHDDKKCCARQIAMILGLDLLEVCDMLSSVSPQFAREEWCTPQCILAFAEKYEFGMVCLWQGKVTLKRAGTPMLAFQVLGSHWVFFQEAGCGKHSV